MKKLLLLTFTFTLFACSGDGDNNGFNNNVSGAWSGTFQTDAEDSGTWTLIPDYEDGGSGYVEYSGEIISEMYGVGELDGYTDEIDGFVAISYQNDGDMPEYEFEADLNGNTLTNAYIVDEWFTPIGTFTGTKN